MRYYLGHKVVKAAKIASIAVGRDVVTIVDEFGHTHIYNKPDLFSRMRTGEVGDYVVEYENGYVSLSPREPLENGYTPLPVTELHLGVMKEPIKYRVVTDVQLQVEADTFDHYMVTFDIGHPIEATAYNCKEPKAVKAGDVLVTYPTGRVEFMTRQEFDVCFNDAPAQLLPKIPEPETHIITDGHSRGHYSNADMLKLESKVEVLAAYDSNGDELDFNEYELSKSSKTNPDLIIVVGRNADRVPGRIVGYIDLKEQRVDFSDGVGAFKLSITNPV